MATLRRYKLVKYFLYFKYQISSYNIKSFVHIKFLKERNFKSNNTNIEILCCNDLVLPNVFCSKNSQYEINLKKSIIFFKDLAYIEIINNGRTILVKELGDIKSNTFFISKLINQIIPYSIYMQNNLVLHASGISNSEKSIIFLGRSGSGKSSLSASFKNKNFISEDSIICDNKFHAIPHTPTVKLSDDIADLLEFNKEKISYITNDRLNRSLYHISNFSFRSKPIKKCYILKWGDKFKISKIYDNKTKLRELYSSSYVSHPLGTCNESSMNEFQQFARFIRKIPIYALYRNKKDFFKDNDRILEHAGI